MEKITNLELRQTNSKSVRSNGDWSSILSKAIQLNDGDELAISKVFIDNVSDTDGKILIENDILASMTFYLYVTSIQHEQVAIGSDGKNYISKPVRSMDPTDGIDGFDYIL